MALVNGGFSHCMDMKKFLKSLLLRNGWFDFKIISQECSLGDPFQKLFAEGRLSMVKYKHMTCVSVDRAALIV